MAKKKTKKISAKRKRPAQRRKSGLPRFWQRNQQVIKRWGLWGGSGIIALVLVILAVSYVSSGNTAADKARFLTEARQALLRGQLDQSLVAYHHARNADPDDKQLAREITMLNLKSGALDNAIAAAKTVVAYDSTSVVGHINLAQLYNNFGDLAGCYEHAQVGLRTATAAGEKYAMIAAAVTLGSYFRQHDQYDSAHFYAGQALFWAQETGDTFDLAIATVGLGFSAMELDSLKRARYLFWQVADISADSYPGFTDLARIGLGDCFYRRGELDSCLAYIAPIEKIYRQRPANPTFAYAAHLLGKVYRDQGHDAEAIEKLTDSYLTWHALGGFADLIENLNDLADIYLQQHEYNNSRKYYVAASQLAQIYDLEQKNRYNINLDSRISARLTPEEYVRAGKEGEALAQEITQGREPIQ